MMNATEIVRRGVLQQQPPVASWGVNLNKDGFRVTSHLPHKNDPFCTTSANQVQREKIEIEFDANVIFHSLR